MSWLSPAYPVGAFSYSGGLEWAVEAGDVKDPASAYGLAWDDDCTRQLSFVTLSSSSTPTRLRAMAMTRRFARSPS